MTRRIMTMNDVIISVPMERYDELLKAEAKLQFLKEYAEHEVMGYSDIRYYLGVKDEGKSDEQ